MDTNNNKYKECKSFCPICLNILDSYIYGENGKAIIVRCCREHGEIKTLHLWDDLETFSEMHRIFDQFKDLNQDYQHLLLDITSKCNLKCKFCFTNGGGEKPEDNFSLENLNKILSVNKKIGNILLYGGEPTLSEKLFDVIKMIKGRGSYAILLTNGLLLDDDYVKRLKEVGIDGVQLSLDGFSDSVYKILRGKEILHLKMKALRALKKENIHTYLFVVLVKEINEKEIGRIIQYVAENDYIKCIYFTSLCYEGRIEQKFKKLLTSEILNQIKSQIGISLKDFLLCTEAQYLFKNFINVLGGAKIQSGSPCDIKCYVYYSKNKGVIPITDLVDLKKINLFLYKSLRTLLDNKNFYKYCIIIMRSIKLLLTQVVLRKNKKEVSELVFKILFVVIHNIIFKDKPVNRIDHFFKIGVSNFMDRYNADFDLFDKCDLYMEYPDGTYGSYCKKNIIYGGR